MFLSQHLSDKEGEGQIVEEERKILWSTDAVETKIEVV